MINHQYLNVPMDFGYLTSKFDRMNLIKTRLNSNN